ncbi:hypothetical protein QBC35DRAFT_470334 [Podospora australis]|uniref:Uncharacterized protein n=1 Tax=Podospora australis TaxID=1536484 RepID=A0AAN6X2J2_9PEZI|nr:hypothetical protein QBC35DRAFT_470334 [Podospora australis]
MAPKRSGPPRAAKKEKKAEIIELSSDSESEEPQVKIQSQVQTAAPTEDATVSEVYEQPLLKAAGIKYKTDTAENQETPSSNAKLSVRTKDTGSVKHKHVSIEIPLPSLAMRDDGNETEVFKTPMERRHKKFDFDDVEDDVDVFVTPSEGLKKDPFDAEVTTNAQVQNEAAEEENQEDSDDDAPPEDISTRAAEAETVKAAEAAAKAAEKQAAKIKKKRQARDAVFKQQAAEKRALETSQPPADESKPEPVEKRKREVPKLLPLDLLDSDDEDDVRRSSDSPANGGDNKRRKVASVDPRLLRDPKVKRDQRLGSTVYRVVADRGNGKLAPKAKKQSINLKETLLRRDRIPHSKTGFFINKR